MMHHINHNWLNETSTLIAILVDFRRNVCLRSLIFRTTIFMKKSVTISCRITHIFSVSRPAGVTYSINRFLRLHVVKHSWTRNLDMLTSHSQVSWIWLSNGGAQLIKNCLRFPRFRIPHNSFTSSSLWTQCIVEENFFGEPSEFSLLRNFDLNGIFARLPDE